MSRNIVLRVTYFNNKKGVVSGIHKSRGCEYETSRFTDKDINRFKNEILEFRSQNKRVKKIELDILLSYCNNDSKNRCIEPIEFNKIYSKLDDVIRELDCIINTYNDVNEVVK